MTGLLIPDDWNEPTDGYCSLSLTVPNSSIWRANVRGAIQGLSLERVWDAQTGDPTQAAQVGKVIFESIQFVCGLLMSDDFNDLALSPFWTHVQGRPGDPAPTLDGSQVSIVAPSGQDHDINSAGIFANRIMQSIGDVAIFSIIGKFNSIVSERYQIQGVLIQEDDNNLLRFDVFHDGSKVKVYAASFVDGNSTTLASDTLPGGTPSYLRVVRMSSDWFMLYSYDGATWSLAVGFSRTLNTSQVGLYAGNAGSNPEHTALIDYFHVL